MRLSVLSALARLDIDPWQEAAELAVLPGATATARLASLIALLPNEPAMRRDPDTIAARLVTLLPSRAGSNATLLKMSVGDGKVTQSWIVIYAVLMVLTFGTQWVLAMHQPSRPADKSPSRASETISARSAPISLAGENHIEQSSPTGEAPSLGANALDVPTGSRPGATARSGAEGKSLPAPIPQPAR